MKYALKVTAILLSMIAAIILILFLVINYFISHYEPKGEFLTETVSPSGDYTVKMYVVRGSATVSNSVRGKVVDHSRKDKEKKIYNAYREEEAVVEWLDDFTVSINGIELDVRKDTYDWRKDEKSKE